jgi:hypothetical protein
MTPTEKGALVAALAKLPPPKRFTAGYGLGRNGKVKTPQAEIGVLILWENTPEGREAASVFAQALLPGAGE